MSAVPSQPAPAATDAIPDETLQLPPAATAPAGAAKDAGADATLRLPPSLPNTPTPSPQKAALARSSPGTPPDGVGAEDDLGAGLALFQEEGDLASDLAPEDDEGSVEYKLMLVEPTEARLQHLITQCAFRVNEGLGECLYELGYEDDGRASGITPAQMQSSIDTLKEMAAAIEAEATVMHVLEGKAGRCAEVMVRRKVIPGLSCVDLRIAVAGNVDSGKSTMIGVLTGNGALDNGRGLARSDVFMHRHEMESGRTSCVSQQLMGFTAAGEVANVKVNDSRVANATWKEIVEMSGKLITFSDLCGHEKYLKTTVSGLSNHTDYCMILVGAERGVTRMTKEHAGVALNLKLPLICAMTKTDLAPEHVAKATETAMFKLLKKMGKLPMRIRTADDVVACIKAFASHTKCTPVFRLSNVSGEGLDLMRLLLNLLPPRDLYVKRRSEPTQLAIDGSFGVTGIGCVVSGVVVAGAVSLGDELYIGPDSVGGFHKAFVKSVHSKRVPVQCASAGQSASCALRKIQRKDVRKAMVLVSLKADVSSKTTWNFTADILVLYHSTTLSANYQPVVHIGAVRQAAKIVEMQDAEVLRTGDRCRCTFRFMYRPEFLDVGGRLVFREGMTKGVGKVVAVEGGAGHTVD